MVETGGAPGHSGEERRTGRDRRSGDRESVTNGTGISISGRARRGRGSFFDHPWWVAGAVLFGLLLGLGVMQITSVIGPKTPVKREGIDFVVNPHDDPVVDPAATTPAAPATTAAAATPTATP